MERPLTGVLFGMKSTTPFHPPDTNSWFLNRSRHSPSCYAETALGYSKQEAETAIRAVQVLRDENSGKA